MYSFGNKKVELTLANQPWHALFLQSVFQSQHGGRSLKNCDVSVNYSITCKVH